MHATAMRLRDYHRADFQLIWELDQKCFPPASRIRDPSCGRSSPRRRPRQSWPSVTDGSLPLCWAGGGAMPRDTSSRSTWRPQSGGEAAGELGGRPQTVWVRMHVQQRLHARHRRAESEHEFREHSGSMFKTHGQETSTASQASPIGCRRPGASRRARTCLSARNGSQPLERPSDPVRRGGLREPVDAGGGDVSGWVRPGRPCRAHTVHRGLTRYASAGHLASASRSYVRRATCCARCQLFPRRGSGWCRFATRCW